MTCIPNNFNNSRRNKKLLSSQFQGGAKTYLNNELNTVPKTIKLEIPNPRNSRNSRGEIHRISFASSYIEENMETDSAELTQKEKLATEVD